MATDFFSEFTVIELKAHLKQLQKGLLNPARQVLFKDQQLTFSTAAEIKERIALVQSSIDIKEGNTNSNRSKKKVLMTTKSRGFNDS